MLEPIDKYCWPVERVTGRPFLNFWRILLHTDIYQTWFRWRMKKIWAKRKESLQAQGKLLQTNVTSRREEEHKHG